MLINGINLFLSALLVTFHILLKCIIERFWVYLNIVAGWAVLKWVDELSGFIIGDIFFMMPFCSS